MAQKIHLRQFMISWVFGAILFFAAMLTTFAYEPSEGTIASMVLFSILALFAWQSWLLAPFLKQSVWWGVISFFGFIGGTILGSMILDRIPIKSFPDPLLRNLLRFGTMSFLTGVIQAWLFLRTVTQRWVWIIAHTSAWIMVFVVQALPVTTLLGLVDVSGWHTLVLVLIGSLLLGLIYGLITGLTLVWLLGKRPPAEPTSSAAAAEQNH